MALLDRFRTQSRHKNPDAGVRLAFVQEIPLDERELLTEIAREDTDPRVRRAAVAKLMDPVALSAIAKDDADEQVRTQAGAMLRDLALEAFEGIGEAESAAAVDAIADAKTLAAIAKSAPREATALRALARIPDAHMLGSIARHAENEAVRRAAFGSLRDHAEILSVAVNSEFKDPTVAAVELITDRGELEQIASRAKNKSAAKRARAILRDAEERVAAEAQAAKDAADAAAAAQRAHEAEEAAARAAYRDPAEVERAAREDAEREAAAERARAEAAERTRAQAEEAERRREADAAQEHARSEAAAEAARKEAARRSARLVELADEATQAAPLEDLAAARRQFHLLRREWQSLAGAGADPDVVSKYTAAEQAFTARDAAAHEEDQRARREALARLQQLASRLEPIAARPDLTLKAGERALKDIRTALGTIPQLPSKKDYEDIVRRLKGAQTALMPKVQELRDVADWQRWANVGIQEQLCEKMEALKAVEDPEEIAKQVRDLQQQWRQAADVPRAQGEALWKRFKAAHDEAWTRCEAHFAAQTTVRAENLARKIALSERAEALAESTNWIQTADEIKKLQAEWKTVGPVSRGQEKAIWERFRAACDRFFTRRHADLAERKTMWAENLAKKEALIAKVDALKDSVDWEATANAIKQLQAEWKTIGPVKKTRSEPLWQRFRGACDEFFARYAQRHDIARGERVAAREAICTELEALAPEPVVSPQSSADSGQSPVDGAQSSGDGAETAIDNPQSENRDPQSETAPEDLLAKVRSLRGRWQSELAARGVDRDRAAELDTRFAAAFARVLTRWPAVFGGTDLDPDANRKRMEALVHRMEELAKSLAGPAAAAADAAISPTTRLAAMLKEALAANTIGGKVDDDSRFRAANDEVRQAQASWSRIGPVPDDTRRVLADRFQRAIRRISDAAAAKTGTPAMAGGPGRPGPPRRN